MYRPNKMLVGGIYVKTRYYITAGGLNWLNTGPVPDVASTVIAIWLSQPTGIHAQLRNHQLLRN